MRRGGNFAVSLPLAAALAAIIGLLACGQDTCKAFKFVCRRSRAEILKRLLTRPRFGRMRSQILRLEILRDFGRKPLAHIVKVRSPHYQRASLGTGRNMVGL